MFSILNVNHGKSFVALLLPHFVAVSPLLHYSYEKMGGGGLGTPILRSAQFSAMPPGRVAFPGNLRPAPPRPYVTPLESTLSPKPYKNPPMSNSIIFKQFQTPCKAPISKSFRMIAFQKKLFFSLWRMRWIEKLLFAAPTFRVTKALRKRDMSHGARHGGLCYRLFV
jgi:hypothetical protein